MLPIPNGPVAAVVAHPDDESFGLGAILGGLAADGREVSVLCLTQGEASTIGAAADLGRIRRRELEDAAVALGVTRVTLLDLPDGGLATIPVGELDTRIDTWLDESVAALIVLEPQGVTGHPDHRAVSAAAERVADRRALPVVEWGIDPVTAARLCEREGLQFQAITDGPGVLDLHVDRAAHLAAIHCHRSQLDDDPVVFRRLAVQGDVERVRIRPPSSRVDQEER